jgi:hypothetical protein
MKGKNLMKLPNILLVAGDREISSFFVEVAEALAQKDSLLSLSLLLCHGKDSGLDEIDIQDLVEGANIILIGKRQSTGQNKEVILATNLAIKWQRKFGFYSPQRTWLLSELNFVSFLFVQTKGEVLAANEIVKTRKTAILNVGISRIGAAKKIADYLFNKAKREASLEVVSF